MRTLQQQLINAGMATEEQAMSRRQKKSARLTLFQKTGRYSKKPRNKKREVKQRAEKQAINK